MMREKLILIILLYSILNIQAQVGINTTNPQTLFHIDGASTTATTNPQSGSITALQASDDVVITNAGNVGIGTLTPSQKLEIVDNSNPGHIRLRDGSEGALRVLVSDHRGIGSWGKVAGVWYAAIIDAEELKATNDVVTRPYVNFANGFISSKVAGSIDQSRGTITVPYTGIYRVTISAYFHDRRTGIAQQPFKAEMALRVKGIDRWNPLSLGYAPSYGLHPTFVSFQNLNANDELSISCVAKDIDYANYSLLAQMFVEYIPQ